MKPLSHYFYSALLGVINATSWTVVRLIRILFSRIVGNLSGAMIIGYAFLNAGADAFLATPNAWGLILFAMWSLVGLTIIRMTWVPKPDETTAAEDRDDNRQEVARKALEDAADAITRLETLSDKLAATSPEDETVVVATAEAIVKQTAAIKENQEVSNAILAEVAKPRAKRVRKAVAK